MPEAGAVLTAGPITMTEADIIAFAELFDPQPYHLDREAGANSIFGGLCASGWQIAAFTTRLVNDALLSNGLDVLITKKVDSMRWKRPLFVDESIMASATVEGITREEDNTTTLDLSVAVINQDAAPVAEMKCSVAVNGGGQ